MEDLAKRIIFTLAAVVFVQFNMLSQKAKRDILFTYGFSWGGFGISQSPTIRTDYGSGFDPKLGFVREKNGRGGQNWAGKRTWGANVGWMIENKHHTSWLGIGFD